VLQRAQKYTGKPIVHTRESAYHKDSIGETKILNPAYDELRMSPESKLSNPYYNSSASPAKVDSSRVYQSYGGSNPSSAKPKASSSKKAPSGSHSKQNSILADESYLALISGRQPEGDDYSPVGKDAQNLLLHQIEDLRRENEQLRRGRETEGPTTKGSARSG